MKVEVVLGIALCAGCLFLLGCHQAPRDDGAAGLTDRSSDSGADRDRSSNAASSDPWGIREPAAAESDGRNSGGAADGEMGIAPRIETFADKRVIRLDVDGFEALDPLDRELAYSLAQAALSGRDILYDRRHPYNLAVRRTIERVLRSFPGDRTTDDWRALETYAKQMWFSCGIHDVSSGNKIAPGFSFDAFANWVRRTPGEFPVRDGQSIDDWIAELRPVMFEPKVDFCIDPTRRVDEAWSLGGRYSAAIEEMILWLERARDVARDRACRDRIAATIESLKGGREPSPARGDIAGLAFGSAPAVNWSSGIVERNAAYEVPCVVLRDRASCERAARLVRALGVSASDGADRAFPSPNDGAVPAVLDMLMAASPVAPAVYGMPAAPGELPSVFDNIAAARAVTDPAVVTEFAWHVSEVERAAAHGELAYELFRAVRDSVGRMSARRAAASAPGEAPRPDPVIAAAHADAVALWSLLDPTLVELGILPSLEVGRAAYDAYLRDALLLSLRRIQPDDSRSTADELALAAQRIVACHVVDVCADRKLVTRERRDGKTYFEIRSYAALRRAFDELARELNRMLREGDTVAADALVDAATSEIDHALLAEVVARLAPLDLVAGTGYAYPRLVGDEVGTRVLDVRLEPPADFLREMLDLSERYSFVPSHPRGTRP